MPKIPISPQDLPTDSDRFGELDEGITYRGTVDMIGEERKDKNDHSFISIRARITEPEEYAGRIIYDPYISLPWKAAPDANASERKNAQLSGGRLGDLARSAEVEAPPGWDTDLLLEREIVFTIKNDVYQNKVRPKIDSYLLKKEQEPSF